MCIRDRIQPDAVWEGSADLKPGLGYPFGKDAATVRLTVTRGGKPLADQPVWLAAAESAPLKLAQDKAEQGAQTLRLFCRGGADTVSYTHLPLCACSISMRGRGCPSMRGFSPR